MSDDVPAVGLLGDDGVVAELRDGLAERAVDVVDGPATDRSDTELDVVVAAGERAVGDVVATEPSTPLVPVDAGAGIRSVPREAVDALPPALLAGGWETERHVPLAVAVGGDTIATAVFDVTLVTAEAARISEFEVVADGQRLDRSRADGVVVATPAGSTDYSRRVDAPVLAPETGLTVAWIAPFRTDPDRWVVDPARAAIHVERDETTVDLLVDDRVTRTIGPDDVVSLRPASPFEVALVPQSQTRYE